MSDLHDNPNLWTRLTRWFKRPGADSLPLETRLTTTVERAPTSPATNDFVPARPSIFRPWAKRDAAIANLQRGFDALTNLMTAVRDSLETQTRQQEELVRHLSNIPELLQSLPEANQSHVETLRAIHQQMAYQSQQQNRLGNVLEKLSEATDGQRKLLHGLNDRTETLEQHDQMISENLTSVSIAMQSVSRNSEQGTQVLQTLREQFQAHDAQLQDVLARQTTRFTIMLAAAIGIATIALVVATILGWKILHQPPPKAQIVPVVLPATQPAVASLEVSQSTPLPTAEIPTAPVPAQEAAPTTAPAAAAATPAEPATTVPAPNP